MRGEHIFVNKSNYQREIETERREGGDAEINYTKEGQLGDGKEGRSCSPREKTKV